MLKNFSIRLATKYHMWKRSNEVYKTIKFLCDDCGKRGLVLRQISVLNLGFWLLLGIGSTFLLEFLGMGWGISAFIGFFLWFGSTAYNIRINKPQCRHCLSINVHQPHAEEKEEAKQEVSK